ncbi:MAG: hypothetical protein ACYS18_03010 [Planctomycetota bacterium]|jgi:hypothetical protein
MAEEKCSHLWDMTNISSGLIVMKRCFQCGKVSTCFTSQTPPLEPSHEDKHFWNFMGGDPALHFDLTCSKCGVLVKMSELVGLMLCTGCDEACQVCSLKAELEPEGTRVCIVCGCRPIDERKQLPEEKFAALEQFFDQHVKSLKSNIKLVPQQMVRSVEKCYADVVSDLETLFATAPEKN